MIWIALGIVAAQFIVGSIGFGCSVADFNTNKRKHAKAVAERKKDDDSYYYTMYAPETYESSMKKYSMWAKRSGLLMVLAPFGPLLVPLAAVIAAGWGIKILIARAVPALTYSGS